MIDYNAIRSVLYEEFDQSLVRAANIQEFKTAACKLFRGYITLISDFFADPKIKKDIAQMYSRLRVIGIVRNIPIDVVNIQNSADIYQDYLGGMIQFISAVVSDASAGNSEIHVPNITIAEEKDTEFVSSVFGGQNSPIKPTPLTDAVSNVEYLVDFSDCLNELIGKLTTAFSEADSVCSDENVRRILRTMVHSSARFSNELMKEAFKTYEMILDGLDGSALSHGGARNYVAPKEVFKLF